MRTFQRCLKAYWQLLRLEHGMTYGFATTVGILISSNSIDLNLILLAYLTALFFQSSTFALNDYFDYYVDLNNKRFDRPLVRGEIKRERALQAFLLVFPLGFLTSYLISFEAFIFASIFSIIGVAYDVKLKEFGFLGNVYIALSMAAPFVFGGIVMKNLTPKVLLLALIAFFCGLGREVMKGIEDFVGDEIRNVRSIARVYGIDTAAKISSTFFIFSVILSFSPLIFDLDFKYIIFIILADIILIKVSIDLLNKKYNIYKFRKETFLAITLGIIAFITSAL